MDFFSKNGWNELKLMSPFWGTYEFLAKFCPRAKIDGGGLAKSLCPDSGKAFQMVPSLGLTIQQGRKELEQFAFYVMF